MSVQPPRTKVIGRVDPGCRYTVEGCMKFAGIGSSELREARNSGIVKPITVGRRRYYKGSQLIEWIDSHEAK